MTHFPIAFVLVPKSLGSRIPGGALATTARALSRGSHHMMGHVTVKIRWTTPGTWIVLIFCRFFSITGSELIKISLRC